MSFSDNIKEVVTLMVSGFEEETIQENQEAFTKLQTMYKKDVSQFLDVIQFARIDFNTLAENVMNIPDSDNSHIVEHIISGLYEHYHEQRITRIEGSACSADKSGFVQGMTLKALQENTNLTLYSDYSNVEHMKDTHKGRAFWSPYSLNDTDEAIALFWKWYQSGD